jgi:hypothetical protein
MVTLLKHMIRRNSLNVIHQLFKSQNVSCFIFQSKYLIWFEAYSRFPIVIVKWSISAVLINSFNYSVNSESGLLLIRWCENINLNYNRRSLLCVLKYLSTEKFRRTLKLADLMQHATSSHRIKIAVYFTIFQFRWYD